MVRNNARLALPRAKQRASVDVEDFDGVVGPGAGQLEPGTLLLNLLLLHSLSLLAGAPRPGPPSQPLHRQRVALSEARCGSREGEHASTGNLWHYSPHCYLLRWYKKNVLRPMSQSTLYKLFYCGPILP